MDGRSFRTLSLSAVIMALAAGCATTGGTAAPSQPEMADITVAALPAIDLAGL